MGVSDDKWGKIVREKIRERNEEKWKREREEKKKLRTFNLTKTDWGESEFLKMKDVRARHFLARIRSGTSELAIETERKYGVPPELRTCMACLSGAETEKHFL